jgi:hypothetical protein
VAVAAAFGAGLTDATTALVDQLAVAVAFTDAVLDALVVLAALTFGTVRGSGSRALEGQAEVRFAVFVAITGVALGVTPEATGVVDAADDVDIAAVAVLLAARYTHFADAFAHDVEAIRVAVAVMCGPADGADADAVVAIVVTRAGLLTTLAVIETDFVDRTDAAGGVVAGITDAVLVAVGLVFVRVLGAVVGIVGDTVSIAVDRVRSCAESLGANEAVRAGIVLAALDQRHVAADAICADVGRGAVVVVTAGPNCVVSAIHGDNQ